jgi:hypothetical protein
MSDFFQTGLGKTFTTHGGGRAKTAVLAEEHLPLLEALTDAMNRNTQDPVARQVGIELLTARHSLGMTTRRDALFVADSIHKHVRQIIEQFFDRRE